MATAAGASNQRRRRIVDAPLQLRLVGSIVLGVCSLAAAILLAIYLSLWVVLRMYDLERDPVVTMLFRNVGLLSTVVVLFCSLIGIWALFWVAILYTHKIAGPLVRIMRTVEQMSRGDFNVHLALRKGDGLQELALALNRLAAYLRSRMPPASGG